MKYNLDRDPTLQREWDYQNDMASTEKLFANDTVNGIRLRYTMLDPVPATDLDALPGGAAGVVKVTLNSVHLEVQTTNADGESLEYLVDGDKAEFFLRRFEPAAPGGPPSWRIIRWRDKPIGEFSFGRLRQAAAAGANERIGRAPRTPGSDFGRELNPDSRRPSNVPNDMIESTFTRGGTSR